MTFPPCPVWCAGDCEKLPFERVHEKTLTAQTVADGDSYQGQEKVDVRVWLDRNDCLEQLDPRGTSVALIDFCQADGPGMVRAQFTAAQLRELAAAALAAADLLDAADDGR